MRRRTLIHPVLLRRTAISSKLYAAVPPVMAVVDVEYECEYEYEDEDCFLGATVSIIVSQ